jgi:hypothetical protein
MHTTNDSFGRRIGFPLAVRYGCTSVLERLYRRRVWCVPALVAGPPATFSTFSSEVVNLLGEAQFGWALSDVRDV